MTDFQAELAARLARNAELAQERARAEQEMDRAVREREEADRRRQIELVEARHARHGELVEQLRTVAEGLKAASPDEFVVRMGWTPSGEEFIARISTRKLSPARTLLVELDRDDDEVLARWRSEVGDSLELWRLLEVDAQLIAELVLQAADQDLWRGRAAPPPFPASVAS
jgi:multidrug efflux pump subunit AcrA (membrane-fusion protein)